MELNTYYNHYVSNLIDVHGVNIAINRHTKEPDGFGGHIITSTTLPEQKVALYDKKRTREIITEHGKSYNTVNAEKLLTMPDTDIVEGDTFKLKNKTYKVVFINQYFNICKQVEIEVINNES